MIAEWTEYTRFLTALIVIMDPFAALPIFLSLTQNYTNADRAHVAWITFLAVSVVLILSALGGEPFLTAIGTSLASFRVGGGIVLLLMAIAMLRGQPTGVRTTPGEEAEAETKTTIGVVPLAIPLLAGPGAISTVIIEAHRYDGYLHSLLIILSILLVSGLLWLVLRLAIPIGNALGKIGLNIINRIFGLILTAIAVEIMANGLKELFPLLAGT